MRPPKAVAKCALRPAGSRRKKRPVLAGLGFFWPQVSLRHSGVVESLLQRSALGSVTPYGVMVRAAKKRSAKDGRPPCTHYLGGQYLLLCGGSDNNTRRDEVHSSNTANTITLVAEARTAVLRPRPVSSYRDPGCGTMRGSKTVEHFLTAERDAALRH